MHLSDSAFPTGLFATSNGLESMFRDGLVKTASKLAELNEVYLEQQVGPCDCVSLSEAYEAAATRDHTRLAYVDAACASFKSVKEAREAAARSGTQLIKCVDGFGTGDETLKWYAGEIKTGTVSGVYPVSLGVCCNSMRMGKSESLLMLAYGFVASSVGAALRLGIIDHIEGQKIIHRLKPLIRSVAADAAEMRMEEAWQFCPQIEAYQMSHERLDSKMFIT